MENPGFLPTKITIEVIVLIKQTSEGNCFYDLLSKYNYNIHD
jgi:hypothetical protein